MRALSILALCLLGSISALAQDDYNYRTLVSAARLHDACESKEWNEYMFCAGYVAGVADMIATEHLIAKKCVIADLPADTPAGKLVPVVAKFIKEHPEASSLGAAALVRRAMETNYPCQK